MSVRDRIDEFDKRMNDSLGNTIRESINKEFEKENAAGKLDVPMSGKLREKIDTINTERKKDIKEKETPDIKCSEHSGQQEL